MNNGSGHRGQSDEVKQRIGTTEKASRLGINGPEDPTHSEMGCLLFEASLREKGSSFSNNYPN